MNRIYNDNEYKVEYYGGDEWLGYCHFDSLSEAVEHCTNYADNTEVRILKVVKYGIVKNIVEWL